MTRYWQTLQPILQQRVIHDASNSDGRLHTRLFTCATHKKSQLSSVNLYHSKRSFSTYSTCAKRDYEDGPSEEWHFLNVWSAVRHFLSRRGESAEIQKSNKNSTSHSSTPLSSLWVFFFPPWNLIRVSKPWWGEQHSPKGRTDTKKSLTWRLWHWRNEQVSTICGRQNHLNGRWTPSPETDSSSVLKGQCETSSKNRHGTAGGQWNTA